jgi:ABC-2 type transport system ATP-binding protein
VTGIEVVGLAKQFGERTAVEGLTFDVKAGEVFGLLGPNGAGKTTTVRILTGLLLPTTGEATVCGLSVRVGGEALRKAVGLLTEQPGLYDRLTARENLLFFIRLYELDAASAWERAGRYLERFGLAGREDEPCGSFSKGMKQKLAIIRAILHEPQVIFLDEPTSGLDPQAARTVRDAVAELAAEGRTIVMCSHNLPEVEQLCTRVAVIKGRLLALETVRQMKNAGLSLDIRVAGAARDFEAVLAALPFGPQASSEGGRLRVVLTDEEQVPEVVAVLVSAGARVHSVERTQRPLEERYLTLVSDDG